eukprot:TRINITY_DN1347_c1_g1_i1.p1 TRINITY_DN1347_c1_g1~~TRINITY_DN1347_c1_g1_i1.p1  ORF type:complete len:364 (+),score=114.45 TRINITY_DN1347_c1_g1_i1:238-1329(+)
MGGKVILRVHCVDHSFKSLPLSLNIKASELLTQLKEKMELEDAEGFSIFVEGVSDSIGERCLEDDEEPVKNVIWDMRGVEADVEAFSSLPEWSKVRQEWESHYRYVLKRRIFMKDQVLTLDRPVQLNLFYIQAVNDVLSGRYPCSQEDAVFLAGLQMQVNFGQHDPTRQVGGFLRGKLADYIPTGYLSSRKPEEWETDIFSEHTPLGDMSADEAKMQYLAHVRKWYFYGAMFWNVRVHNYEAVSLPQSVVLAVNSEGIHIMKAENKELISAHSFTDIYSWAYKVNAFAFVSGSISRLKYQFETEFGKDIARTLQAYVDVLLSRHKSGAADDEDEDEEDEEDDEEEDIAEDAEDVEDQSHGNKK